MTTTIITPSLPQNTPSTTRSLCAKSTSTAKSETITRRNPLRNDSFVKSVTFGHIEIREYDINRGDHKTYLTELPKIQIIVDQQEDGPQENDPLDYGTSTARVDPYHEYARGFEPVSSRRKRVSSRSFSTPCIKHKKRRMFVYNDSHCGKYSTRLSPLNAFHEQRFGRKRRMNRHRIQRRHASPYLKN